MSTLTALSFWFLRHGETDLNTKSLAQGNFEVPLNAQGIAQAHAAAATLKGRGITVIVSSPLGRARDTAGIVAEAIDAPVIIDDRLHEVSFGVMDRTPIASEWFVRRIARRSAR